MKEASARIKPLESAGWRFFDGKACKTNIQLNPKVGPAKLHI